MKEDQRSSNLSFTIEDAEITDHWKYQLGIRDLEVWSKTDYLLRRIY
jgi:hypothetical protein